MWNVQCRRIRGGRKQVSGCRGGMARKGAGRPPRDGNALGLDAGADARHWEGTKGP